MKQQLSTIVLLVIAFLLSSFPALAKNRAFSFSGEDVTPNHRLSQEEQVYANPACGYQLSSPSKWELRDGYFVESGYIVEFQVVDDDSPSSAIPSPIFSLGCLTGLPLYLNSPEVGSLQTLFEALQNQKTGEGLLVDDRYVVKEKRALSAGQGPALIIREEPRSDIEAGLYERLSAYILTEEALHQIRLNFLDPSRTIEYEELLITLINSLEASSASPDSSIDSALSSSLADYGFLATLRFPWRPGDREPRRETQDWRGHSAVGFALDFGKPASGVSVEGSDVLAPASGTACWKQGNMSGGYGNYVDIDVGNGWQIRLAHLLDTRSGCQYVNTGDVVGRLSGSGGWLPHIHVEILLNWGQPDFNQIQRIFGHPRDDFFCPDNSRCENYFYSNNSGNTNSACENYSYDGVVLFADAQCTGDKREYNYETVWINVSDFNDRTSSIHVGSGWSVKVYEHSKEQNNGGLSRCIDHRMWDLSVDYYDGSSTIINDTISSIEVFHNSTCSGGSDPGPTPGTTWHAKFDDGTTCWWDTNCGQFNGTAIPDCERDISSSDGRLHQDWGSGDPCGGSLGGDDWVGEFKTSIDFPADNYVFHIDHDDGVKLWLGTENIADRGGSGSGYTCPARSLSGNVNLRAILREESGDAKIHVTWTTDDSACRIGTPSPQSPGNGSTISEGSDISLCWSSAANASQYYAEYWGGPAGTINSGWQSGTCWDIGSQWAGYDYNWRVRARNSNGNVGDWSGTSSFTVRLAAPSNLTAQAVSSSAIQLSWSDNSGSEDGFRVYRNGAAIATVGSGVTGYEDSGLSCATGYTYMVKAYRGSVQSASSNSASATTASCSPDPPSPANPADWSVFNAGSDLELCWNDVTYASGYLAEFSGGPAGTITSGWQSGTCWHIGAQWPGYTYSWQVKARNSSGESDWSNTRSFTVLPIEIVEDLALTPANPIAGETVQARFTVKNAGPEPVTVRRLLAGSRGPECTEWSCAGFNDFPLQEDIALEPGESYTYDEERPFAPAGDGYFAQIVYGLGADEWRPMGNRTEFNVGPGLTIDDGVTLTPAAPLAREPITATYSVRNDGPRPLLLSYLGLVARGPDCTTWECPWNDFPHDENVTLEPGEVYSYSGRRSFSEAGSGYFAEPAFGDANGWWFPVPGSSRVGFEIAPGMVLVEDLSLTPAQPQAGETVTARFKLRNDSSHSITLRRLGVGAKGPDCTDWTCPAYQDFPWKDHLTLSPGETYSYEEQRTFAQAGGGYFAQVIYGFTDDDWQHVGTERHFSVGAGIEVVEPLAIDPAEPWTDLPITATYTIQNKGTRTITLPHLGLAARGPDCTAWPCSSYNDFPAVENITLAPGETYTYRGSRSFAEAGSDYQAQAEFAGPNDWWTAFDGASRLAFSVQPGLEVVEDLTLTPAAPLAGETVTARFKLHNPTSQTLTLKRLGVGAHGPDCVDWDCARPHDFPWLHDVVLGPGGTYTYEEERSFTWIGDGYFAQIIYGYREQDWPRLGTMRHFSVSPGIEVSQPLSLSDEAPTAGMPVTATFTIRNVGGHTIDLPAIRAISRGPDCTGWECSNALDFPSEAGISLAPGKSHTYSQQQAFDVAGAGYFAEAAYADSNGWWTPLPGATRKEFIVTPGISVIEDVTLSPAAPVTGEMVTATFTIRNDASHTLTVRRLVVGVQGPECDDWSCDRPQDYPWLSDIVLEPGGSYTYKEHRPFLAAGDGYFAQIIYGLGAADWHDVGIRREFAVQPGLTMVGDVTLTPGAPMAGDVVTATYTIRNDAPYSLTLPAMGAIARGPGCTSWECEPVLDFPHAVVVQLAPGATHTYQSSRAFSSSGGHFAVPAFSDLKGWWYTLPGGSQFNFTVGSGIELIEDLALTPADPQVGEMVRGSFTLRNAGSNPVTLSRIGIGGRGPGCDAWSCSSSYQDFPWVENVTLQPGESYEYEGRRLFNAKGDYFVQGMYTMGEEEWHHVGSERHFMVVTGLEVVEALALSPTTPMAYEPVVARYVVRNAGTRTIAISHLGTVARGPDCDSWECNRPVDFPHEEDVNLAPGETHTYTGTRTFSTAGQGYFAQAAYADVNNRWFALPKAERTSFEVASGSVFKVFLPVTVK